ncbi:MAG: SusC/RagA family TonB-linked outer membrane protein [Cyclobacteriaceae bacterium]|nr:SusC/RagA family TonB-linked outer membrane protein [Cyclobacteriaceae bacterium HetDA_MAG_MS6]
MKKSYVLKWIRGTVTAMVVMMLSINTSPLWAQSGYKISGTATEASGGEPVIGASVLIDGTTFGTITDIEGNYSFTASVEAGSYNLIISSVGYKTITQSVDLGSSTTVSVDFQLDEDILGLDEVVVTGSSFTASRRQLGNAISSIKADDIVQATPANVSTALQGKIPGARIVQNSGDPAGGFSVKLRGASTIFGSSEPLYVIDGLIISNSTNNVTNTNVSAGASSPGQNRLADLNPNDIESMEIINGAAAAVIYGSRASNGVVLITTKKGLNQKPQFTFSSSVNINELREKVYITRRGEQFGSADQRLYTIAGSDPVTGGLTVGRNFSTDKVSVTRYDYQDEIFQTGVGTDNHLSVRGGDGKTSYYASVGYLDNEGIIKNTDFKRLNARLNLENRVSDEFKFAVNLNYTNSKSNEKPDGNVFWSPINSINITNNIWDITQRDEAGNLQSVEPTRVNPLSVIEDFDITQETNRVLGNVQLTWAPLDGLSIDYLVGVDAFSQRGRIFIPPYPYSPVNATYFDDGYASSSYVNSFFTSNDINVVYAKDLTSSISSTTQAGFNYQFTESISNAAQGRGLAPFVETANGASIQLPTISSELRSRIWGYFLQQTFSYEDRLFLTFGGRVDASTVFGKDNRNQFYPKASLSYLVSDEGFWSGLSGTINTFKLRASYGQAGNLTVIGPYSRFTRYTASNLQSSTAFNAGSQLGDLDIGPERQEEIEFGADMAFLNSRIGLTFNYYSQQITDLVLNVELPASQGGTSIVTNVGEMENKGIELGLNASVVKTSDFEWNVWMNYTRNRNKVTKVDFGSGNALNIPNSTGAPIAIREGEPISIFYGTYYARDDNGNLLLTDDGLRQQERGNADTNEPMRDTNGQPTGDPLRRVIGDPNPDYIVGLGSDFKFKNLGAGFVIESVQGVDVFDADKRTRQGVGIGEFAERELSGDLPRGWIWAIYPIQEFRMENGSFTKLREVYLSYTIPSLLNGGLKNVTFTASGRNLFSIDNFFSYDPETNAGGQSNTMLGVNFGNVPIPRVYTFTIKANF